MEVEHKGHKIRYREDENEWWCDAIGVKPSLKAMKTAIDGLSRKDRQLGIPALMLERDWRKEGNTLRIIEVKVGTLCEPTKGYRDKVATTIKECWISIKGSRSKVSLSELYPLDARADLQAYIVQKTVHEKEDARLTGVLEGIDAFNSDSIMLAAKEEKAK